MSSKAKINDPDLFLSMNDLELVAQGIVEGALHGMHRSPYVGFSVEFESHREYQFGDDLRHVNWNLWARTNELFVKQFKCDTNLNLYLLMDISGSMLCANGPAPKWEYAARAAAALGFLSIGKRDAAGITLLHGKVKDHLPAALKPNQLENLIYILENPHTEGEADISLALKDVAMLCQRRGIVVLFSDFFDNEEQLLRGLSELRFMGHEVLVVHILDPYELALPETGNYEFVDLEKGVKVKASCSQLRESYGRIVSEWQENIRVNCQKIGVDYLFCTTADPLRDLLIDYLNKRTEVL